MKISKINIHNYFQFQDLELDLTYPKGHEKEGQALDKVCLIGQSGTGKTTLLELVKTLILSITRKKIFHFDINSEINTKIPDIFLSLKPKNVELENLTIRWKDSLDHGRWEYDQQPKESILNLLLYFPASISNFVITSGGILKADNEIKDFFYFDKSSLEYLWNRSSGELGRYQLDEADYRVKLTRQAEREKKIIDFAQLMERWKVNNPNPLEKIAQECLNPLLNRFHLAVQTEIEDYRNAKFLQIRSLQNGNIIPYEKLSSGTRQILYTAFPIYQLLEENSIILMDEPENSLYPDMQQEIIQYYTSFDKEKKSQFFFATHSPIIASAFEPWEIVELKFKPDGTIYRELYYEGENHVDNYHTDPRYLRWDSILTKVFDLKTEGNERFRSEKLMDYSMLKREIEALEKEGQLKNPSKKTKEIIRKFEKAGELLDWETSKL
ncbi:MAG: AAA family ATPase [Bacteroidota bacterium]